MIHQSPAQIYKAQQRGHIESTMHRLFATLDFEVYSEASRGPFGILETVNDETLAPQHTITRTVDNKVIILLPLANGIEYTYNGTTFLLSPGDVALLPVTGELNIKNPYKKELVNFLYIAFSGGGMPAATQIVNLDMRNTLHSFLDNYIKGRIGIFDGRQEAVYTLSDPANGLFFFVINGAFEVSGRLLQERDALALWQTNEADMEALSENSILLIFEIPLR